MKILVAFLLFSSISFCQETGGLSGKLVSDSCVAIAFAHITISEVRDKYPQKCLVSMKTDRNGDFSVDGLPVGTYEVLVDLRDKFHGGINYSDMMSFRIVIEANSVIKFDELIFESNLLCTCQFIIVPYVAPRDPFGRSTTFTRDEIRMR